MTDIGAVADNYFPLLVILFASLLELLFKEAGIEIPAVAHLLNAHEKFIRSKR